MTDGTLSEIHLHPVKSCRRVEVPAVDITATGLAGDRVWQVVDADGTCVTQRQHRALATISTSFADATPGARVTVSAEGQGSVDLDPDGGDEWEVRSLIGRRVAGRRADAEASEWISDLLGAEHHFVTQVDPNANAIPPRIDVFGQPITFVDLAPVLLATTSSLNWLVNEASEPFGMDRFRANLVIDNDAPWAEDTWAEMALGDAVLGGQLPWPRCAVPQIDQDTGDRRSEPARALRSHRWCSEAPSVPEDLQPILEGNGLFGLACSITPVGATLSVGDQLRVRSHREPVIANPALAS